MRAKLSAVCLGLEAKSFDKKDASGKVVEVIDYRRAKFSTRGTTETFVLSVPRDLDCSLLADYQDAHMLVEFRFDEKYGTFKGRLLNLFSDAKAMAAAPLLSQSEAAEAAQSSHHA
ncbi:hypothetical protein GS424_008525 [Eggerthella guodeyinii]|uniref:Uncharacterized protein n=1 Tax=Eggerthella guodeyinii TaxID=2690837 RepID=A0A6L7IPW6_9ACTN|nr:hypothetical protein [Eggerthella guodeyinii]QOS69864.1 hypothetical protein GS424_008525 [Eggerthella guodeyinii]